MKAGQPLSVTFARLWNLAKQVWDIRFIRFLVVGGINTAFGYLVYAIFILLHVNYAVALSIGQVLGILFNFNTTGRIVFQNKDSRLLLRFFGVYGITYLINLGVLSAFNSLNFNMLVAGLIMVLPSALLSFFLNKKFVFNSKSQQKGL